MNAVLITFAMILAADPAAEPKDPPQDTAWQKLFAEYAAQFRIAPRSNLEKTFSLRAQPVLRWNQPVRGGDDGAVFLWLDGGRPAVIGTIFCWPLDDGLRQVQQEFHSLAREPIEAHWRDKPHWSPAEPGVTFKPVADAPVPAKSAALRLAQMREIGRGFRALNVDLQTKEWELRLLAQPLYRYELKADDELLDGAIFTFASGTDPEIIFLLEAQKDKDGAIWRYAAARFSDRPLRLFHKDAEVWRVERARTGDLKSVHLLLPIERRRPPVEEAKQPKP